MRLILVGILFCLGNSLLGQQIDTSVIKSIDLINLKDINTSATEFAPFRVHNELFYVTEGRKGQELDSKTNERYWDIKKTIITGGGKGKSAYLPTEINSPYFESAIYYSAKDSLLYFTRTNWEKGGLNKTEEDAALLRIFVSKNIDGTWTESKVLPFQDLEVNFCHPTVIEEENILIFSSNMEGGYGQMDLYKIPVNANSIEEAENLGPEINSAGNDIFPFYHKTGNLFYASDYGTGENKNLNIFGVLLTDPESTKSLLGFQFESESDDFSLYVDDEGLSGYISSNRKGGQGLDDIYYFESEQSIFQKEPEIIIEEIIEADMSSHSELTLIFKNLDLSNISDVNINLYDLSDSENEQLIKADSSRYTITDLEIGNQYKLVVEKEGYHSFYKSFVAEDVVDEILVFLEKQPEPEPIVEEPEEVKEIVIPKAVGSVVVFNNIYYAYNSSEIKEGGADELDVLVRAMKNQKTMKVRLVAHTDSRGKSDYNMLLSERRAYAAKKYLMSKGIDSYRILTLGVGESQIRNHCKNGVSCSDREHRYNRRTEVQIVEQ